MGQFLDALHEIQLAEADKVTLAELATRYPDLDKKVVAASAYDKVRGDLQALDAKFQDANGKLITWDEWRKNNWSEEHGKTLATLEMETKLAAAIGRTASLEAAITAGNGSANSMLELDQLKAFLTEQGVVTKTDLSGLAKLDDVTVVRKALDQQAVNFEHIFYGSANLPLKFEREFGALGQDFDMRGFVEYALADPTGARAKDLNAAYQAYVEPMRGQLKFKQEQEAFAKERADFEAQKAAAIAAAGAHSATEGADEGGPGHFQKRLMGQKEETEINLPLDNPNLAAVAAEQYRKGDLTSVH